MANTFAPFGFRQYSGTGSAPTYEQVVALIASTDTNPIYFGDPVTPLNTGYITASTAPGTTQIAGVFVGCTYLSVSQKRTVWSNYWPGSDANGDVTAYIINDPNAKFTVQVSGAPITTADLNSNVQYAYGSGSTSNGISGAYVTQASSAVTATLPFRVVGLVTSPPGANGTDVTSNNNVVIVAFNNVSTKQLTSVG